LALVHVGIYAAILTLQYHDLYYRDVDFAVSGQFPVFIHRDGIVHHIFFGMQTSLIIVGMTVLIATFVKERKKNVKKRLFVVIIAFLIEIFFFMAQVFNLSDVYDFTMIGSIFGTICMFISIFRYNLLGTRDIARDFMVDRLSEGVIAIDNDGDVQYVNEPAKALFPGIDKNPEGVIDSVKGAILHGETIRVNDRIYTPEENDLLYNGRSFGKLFVLIDATEHFNRLNNEKNLLRKELLTDPLTGFYNRKGMVYYSDEIYHEILEGKKQLFLCVADMNGLKYINDNFGHEQGDRAITELAKIIKESLEEGDIAFRTGGDEFLVMGPRNSAENVEKDYAARIEELIAKHNEGNDFPYRIDMSYGPLVSPLTGEDDELEKLIKLSDSRMYEMKKSRDSYRRK
ncbi:MAG: diguanylate cyclase, partial [Lachnospiraceae bacterium]|nr:diguanylate cyclase [Lachnospiraceae bacterium]